MNKQANTFVGLLTVLTVLSVVYAVQCEIRERRNTYRIAELIVNDLADERLGKFDNWYHRVARWVRAKCTF